MRTYPNTKLPCNCQNCGKSFMAFPSVVKKGGGKFCSMQCRGIAKRGEHRAEHIDRTCQHCGKAFSVRASAVARGNRGRFCSRQCVNDNRSTGFDERFWSRVDSSDPDGCWLWAAGAFEGGYGAMVYGGKLCKASRIAWELTNGPIPDGLWVLHRCDNPPCCNPAHLFIGTPRDNTHDALRKGRWCRTPGEARWSAKLRDVDVIDIRNRYVPRKVTLKDLADEYGVTFQLISMIVNRKIWTHI